ncbi:zinc ribbon domain-containing protein [Intestinimonas butyriciproducens]|uniref:zinc ribbon domain-containing protein n=1 Tax=Intestinimonas butyriciproducens TaxID=1297617 RepID=UPI00189AE53E|nr:zinc ribbon domain-containing protein [Intestinimonas butyriciproducens]MCI6363016.1 helix-turn-helix domain-containing protein [Intestinimonas butyriciproducens]MDB7831143.1 zinc ribbon domain-containing protein [Intestinimonas butyriciproducens]MDB7860443.1 zinc ribbon domain-containing protein [Intestinimonas butyriciproducens]MDB7863768.1 zinc ribbon domain-containing protein [Intestinimonas butyriciproducens]MDY3615071.1 zinc ribbon domain-containing protein [Intestinimonas butyricipro
METKNAILELRRHAGLSQDAFAERLLVTRQAVSKWESGDTVPSTDTLRRIAELFHVSVDYLLGRPAALCQSCGMSLVMDSDKGTRKDGSRSEEYCAFCFQHGAFTQDLTMEELIEHNLQDLSEWNQAVGLQLTEQEARAQLMEFLPTLKRWKA